MACSRECANPPALLRKEVDLAPERINAEQITIYGGGGLAFQDAVAAWQIYRTALSQGLGVRAADDFAELGANRARSELCAADRAHADGEVAIVTDEDSIAANFRADLAFTGLVGTDRRNVRSGLEDAGKDERRSRPGTKD